MADSKRQYPAMVYHKDQSTIVQNEEAFNALGAGWYDSPADVKEQAEKADPVTGQVPHAEFNANPAPKPELPAPIGPNPSPRDHLLYQAESLGMKVDKRVSDETLRRQIFEFGSQ